MVDIFLIKPHSLYMNSVNTKFMRLINLVAVWYRHARVCRVSCYSVY